MSLRPLAERLVRREAAEFHIRQIPCILADASLSILAINPPNIGSSGGLYHLRLPYAVLGGDACGLLSIHLAEEPVEVLLRGDFPSPRHHASRLRGELQD